MARQSVLLLLLAMWAHASSEECHNTEVEEAALLQASKVSKLGPWVPLKCYRAVLVQDTEAVPKIDRHIYGTAEARILVDKHHVKIAEMSWDIPSVANLNQVIGLHIHVGDGHKNGRILVGFCGASPLPPFSGPCPHSSAAAIDGMAIDGEACTLNSRFGDGPCEDSPDQYGATIEGAAANIMNIGRSAYDNFYLNLHTNQSFQENKATDPFSLGPDGNGPLGLIRGQLIETSCD